MRRCGLTGTSGSRARTSCGRKVSWLTITRRWFGSFLNTIPNEWTAGEVAGITERLPLPAFRRVLDVCCGNGRHACPLAAAGYEVTGVDRDSVAVAQAERRVPSATFRVLDQRQLGLLDQEFDAAMILWRSFGYFDPTANEQILADLATRLRPGGRLLLDLYHPGFVGANVGVQTAVRAPDCGSITDVVNGGRLISTISYVDGTTEAMDLELFEPETLASLATRHGSNLLEACSWWDRQRPATPSEQRYQLVLERSVSAAQ